jgi:hypothetical protein
VVFPSTAVLVAGVLFAVVLGDKDLEQEQEQKKGRASVLPASPQGLQGFAGVESGQVDMCPKSIGDRRRSTRRRGSVLFGLGRDGCRRVGGQQGTGKQGWPLSLGPGLVSASVHGRPVDGAARCISSRVTVMQRPTLRQAWQWVSQRVRSCTQQAHWAGLSTQLPSSHHFER